MRHWLQRVGIHTVFITPGSPWENGSRENVNGAFRDDRLDRELFDTLWEMLVLVKRWRQDDNRIRPHRAPGYHPPQGLRVNSAGGAGTPTEAQLSREERRKLTETLYS